MKNLILSLLFFNFAFSKPPRVVGNRVPSYPFISGDGFRAMADHVYDETDSTLVASEISYADIVFVKSDYLEVFFKKIHKDICCPYILISHNSDASAPGNYESYLNDEKIIRWYGQNPTIQWHKKFIPIPIGVANRYVGKHGNVNNFISMHSKGSLEKKQFNVGLNFNAGTNLKERKYVYDYFSEKFFVQKIFSNDHLEYLKKMALAKFILSPAGNGLDCHRTWEAFIVGSIPILIKSHMDELLSDMPVLIVDKWDDVSLALLEEAYIKIQQKRSNLGLNKIYFDFWQNLIKSEQKRSRI